MAENPSLIPADLIEQAGADLTQKLTQAARRAAEETLAAGSIATVEDVLQALENLTDSLPPALVTLIEAELPRIAAEAVTRAEAEIAPAREESGEPFPPVQPEPAGDYRPWAGTAAAGLIAAMKQAAEAAPTAEAARAAAVDAIAEPAFSVMAETAAARTVNQSRLNTFKSNDDIVRKLKVVTIHDAKRSEVCTYMSDAEFNIRAKNIPVPPYHAGCRSYLVPVTAIRRKAGATDKEIERQNWAVFRRLEREAKAKEAAAEGRGGEERLEFRFAPDLDAAGTFKGLASAYGVLDAHNTEFRAGAFSESLSERRGTGQRIPILLHHDPRRVAGVVTNLADSPEGLLIEGRFITDTPDGREGYALARAGGMSLSVGFKRLADLPRPGGGRIITKARLAEISLVSVASNPKARILEVRSANPDDTPAAGAAKPHEEIKMSETTAPAGAEEVRNAVDALARRLDKIEARGSRLPLGGDAGNADDGLEKRAFSSFVRSGPERLAAEEVRALTVSTDAAGGYLVPDDFQKELLKKLVLFSPVRQLARLSQAKGAEIILPARTGTITAAWVAEGAARPNTQPVYGQVKLVAHEIGAYVDVSNALLEDSVFDLEGELSQDFAEEFGRLEGTAFISGDGIGKPKGLLEETITEVNSGAAAAITSDGLIDLFHSLPSFYAANGAWAMNRATIGAVRKLKDGAGRYLWTEPLAAGNAPTILGRPVVEVPDMPNIAAGENPVAFGDWQQGFRIFDRVNLSVLRDPYSVQVNGLVRFHARRPVAGGVVKPEAFRLLKIAA